MDNKNLNFLDLENLDLGDSGVMEKWETNYMVAQAVQQDITPVKSKILTTQDIVTLNSDTTNNLNEVENQNSPDTVEELIEGNEAAVNDINTPISNYVADKAVLVLKNIQENQNTQNLETNILNQQISDFNLNQTLFIKQNGGFLLDRSDSNNSITNSDNSLFAKYIQRFRDENSEVRYDNIQLSTLSKNLLFLPKVVETVSPYNFIIGNKENNILNGTSGRDIIYGSAKNTSNPVTFLTISNPNSDITDSFSFNVAIKNNLVITSAILDDTGATDAGSVYLFDSLTGNLLQTFNNPTPSNNDQFGWNIDIDGNTAIIGAIQDDTGNTDTGSVYIFNTDTGNLIRTINNPITGNFAHFGSSVALDGNIALIGAELGLTGGSRPGVAHLYDVTSGVKLFTLNNPTPTHLDYFGYSVDLDNGYALVGAILDDTGAVDTGSAYIFNANTGNLLHTLNNPDPQVGDAFGSNVAINDSYALIGANSDNSGVGSAYLYDVSTGNLIYTFNNPTPVSNDRFGWDVSITNNYAIISSPWDDTSAEDNGSVYLYDVNSSDLLLTLNNPSSNPTELFGYSVDVDGNTLVVGARNDNAYIYQIDFTDSDILYGGSGIDYLFGLYGDDQLYGQAGADKLTGGEGADRFVFQGANAFSGIDTIEDFNQSQGDIIDISDVLIGYNFGVDNILDFARFIDNGANTTLEIDADGLTNGSNYLAAAFIIGGAGLDIVNLEALSQLDTVA